MAWLEEFEIWRRSGRPETRELTARQVEAMMLLEQELAAEMKSGNEQ